MRPIAILLTLLVAAAVTSFVYHKTELAVLLTGLSLITAVITILTLPPTTDH